jgi:hypothetical protein
MHPIDGRRWWDENLAHERESTGRAGVRELRMPNQ